MLKWILGIIYAFVLIIISVFIFREADAERRLSYLHDYAQQYYESDDLDNYMYHYTIATSRHAYISTPLYQAVSDVEGSSFVFSLFHTNAVTEKGSVDVIATTLSHLDIDVIPQNIENYEAEPNLIRIRLNINLDEGHLYQDYSLEGESLAITSNASLGAHIPIEFSVGHNEPGVSLFGLSEGTATTIDSITLEILDYTEEVNNPKVSYLAHIVDSKDNSTSLGFVDHFEVREVEVPLFSDRSKNTTVETLVSTSFVGDANWFDIGQIYESSSPEFEIIIVEKALLKPYDQIIVRYFVIYGVIAVILTYLLFFLKPTISYIRKRKAQAALEDYSTEDAIFKEHD